jgi:hypothetical protein
MRETEGEMPLLLIEGRVKCYIRYPPSMFYHTKEGPFRDLLTEEMTSARRA